MKKSGHSDIAIKYYLEKTNIGEIENPDAQGEHTSIVWGDTLYFFLKIIDGIIKDIKFQATSCIAGLTIASAVTILAGGRTLEDAKKITEEDIMKHLKCVPIQKSHCVVLALEALKNTIKNYEGRKDG